MIGYTIGKTINFYNCYGKFTPGTDSSKSDYVSYNSIFINGPAEVDDKFNILSHEQKHAGTGENPDGTPAHIGVYGGPFAWSIESNSHLIKDENNILTYDLINKTWIPLAPSQKNFENHGITDFSNLIINTSKTINFKNKLGSGQIFKESINFNAYKTITNIKVI